MKEFGLKICLFLFLTALFSGRGGELGTLTGAITGTVLLWPLYQRVLPASPPRVRRRVQAEAEEPATE